MKDLSTPEDYKDYYGSFEMQRDLLNWFDLDANTSTKYFWVKFPCEKNGKRRFSTCYTRQSSTRQKSFYFSFCIYFFVLQSQAIHLLGGEEAMHRYHRETGVPYFSCGLGGEMHPIHTIWESDLAPDAYEVDCYRSMLKNILCTLKDQVAELDKYVPTDKLYPFILEEVQKFIKVLDFKFDYRKRSPKYMLKFNTSTDEYYYNKEDWNFD